jgi:hypothetical protein
MVRAVVRFHHSLVIAVCAEQRHSLYGNSFPSLEGEALTIANPTKEHDIYDEMMGEWLVDGEPMDYEETETETAAVATKIDQNVEDLKTLDLHTASLSIGRVSNLDISLKDLRLHEYATDGILTLYAVFRNLDKNWLNTQRRLGKEAIYSFNKSWVCGKLALFSRVGASYW